VEKINYQLIQTKDFADAGLIKLRFNGQDSALENSVKELGIINPLLVIRQRPLAVIDGHRRLLLARKLKIAQIPCLCIDAKISDQELFKMALIRNWNAIHDDMDKAQCLKTAHDYAKLSVKQIEQDILPSLGLKAEKHIYETYVRTLTLVPELLDLIASKKLPFRGSQGLFELKTEDQICFAREIAAKTNLTTNALLKAAEWLRDLLRTTGISLGSFLRKYKFQEILDHPKWDARLKAEKLIEGLRKIRRPKLTAMEEKLFEQAAGITAGENDMAIRFPQDLEESGFMLQMKLRDRRSLERLQKTLGEKKDLLNSLFDLML